MSETNIIVKGARVNNLKNISVVIPRNRFTVITGLSGSGKSSLAFDTLYAEGRRRYVESLSAYARQFMGKMVKPECDFIRGLPPAIAIEQKVNTRNPRSTVGTSTEIYDYLRMLFGRIGKTFSPISGEQVKKHGVEDIIATAAMYPVGTRIAVIAPIDIAEGRSLKDQLDIYVKEGFSRIVVNNEFIQIEDAFNDKKLMKKTSGLDLLIDRLAVAEQGDELSRLADSTETAFFEGNDRCALLVWEDRTKVKRYDFSKRFEADGMTFPEPSDVMFNFNNPYGACPRCEGFGNILGISERLVIPNPSLSIYADAVAPWRGPIMGELKRQLIAMAPSFDFPIHRAYEDLTDEQRNILWHGKGEFPGLDGFFKWMEDRRDKIQYRVMLARYRGKTVCPECGGSRLRREASYVRIADKTMPDIVKMSIIDLRQWFANLQLDEHDSKVAARLMTEITNRLAFLDEVGLGYLTLDRLSNTLSGGESQRINLATSLGSSLVGSLYILDEPSIGLHSRDTKRLIGVLRKLQRLGNTVIVVEHDEDIIRAADNIIDVGPDAGRLGGEIVYQGPVDKMDNATKSYTLKYLNGMLKIATPTRRRKWNSYIEVVGAAENNLKHIDVRFPLGVMTVVTGVSGSGKSTLVRDILYNALARRLDIEADAPGRYDEIRGDVHRISDIVFVDQNPIGKSSRSNPATYLKAYDEIRALFASQQSAKQMGFSPSYFSFNTEGGRCEECKGEGKITIEMQFLADVTLTCEACHGQRFKRDVLEVRYRDQNINDILNMTVNQAIEFFGEVNQATEQRIVRRLQPLKDVGLGYIKLGQSSSTLSGGENQRVKLAYFLSEDKPQPTMFIFDEPTTGLHFHDINVLMESFNRLISLGHTLVIIEHNMDVIKCADHIIDIGPEGGADGGRIVVTGTPEDVAKCPDSYTGKYLKEHL
jgi:excinuclease ABC subunit A